MRPGCVRGSSADRPDLEITESQDGSTGVRTVRHFHKSPCVYVFCRAPHTRVRGEYPRTVRTVFRGRPRRLVIIGDMSTNKVRTHPRTMPDAGCLVLLVRALDLPLQVFGVLVQLVLGELHSVVVGRHDGTAGKGPLGWWIEQAMLI